MRLYTCDEQKMVDVGTGSLWFSVYSTAEVGLSDEIKKKTPLAMSFLKTGDCLAENVEETKEQLLFVWGAFSILSPSRAVYDFRRPDATPPWWGTFASTVTSCGNLYTTADGKDLFTEVYALLKYAAEHNLSVFAG